MKALSLLLLLISAVSVFGQASDPGKTLFDTGTRDEQVGRLDRAKLTLLTMAATYPDHPLTSKAKVEIGAIYMFLEAQAQVQAGKISDGYGTFRTLMRVYPESPLAKLADETVKSLGIPADPRR
jgi:outer membrane protein assembly factor BamD (BamD/ComL family)